MSNQVLVVLQRQHTCIVEKKGTEGKSAVDKPIRRCNAVCKRKGISKNSSRY